MVHWALGSRLRLGVCQIALHSSHRAQTHGHDHIYCAMQIRHFVFSQLLISSLTLLYSPKAYTSLFSDPLLSISEATVTDDGRRVKSAVGKKEEGVKRSRSQELVGG